MASAKSSYEKFVETLYRAPHGSFVAERQRLLLELKAEGDKAGAARLAKSGRPSISAWAVNQLWWQARESFDELFETAAQLRAGNLAASAAHRKVVMKLGVFAQKLLSESGHSANDATLRRVTMTLAGLAAAGSFEPELPGALTKDRDPPGFEAFGITSSREIEDEPVATKHRATAHETEQREALETKGKGESETAKRKREHAAAERDHAAATAERKREHEAAERERAAAIAERKREAEARAKRLLRRSKLESELREAKAALAEREHERDRVAKLLAVAEREVERARESLEAAGAALDSEPDA